MFWAPFCQYFLLPKFYVIQPVQQGIIRITHTRILTEIQLEPCCIPSLFVQSASIIEGLNVYAVQRAAKTSSTEAIVLAVMVEKDNNFTLAMLTDLAEYLSSKPLHEIITQ